MYVVSVVAGAMFFKVNSAAIVLGLVAFLLADRLLKPEPLND